MVKHSVREELHGVLAFVGAIWCVFLVGLVVPLAISLLVGVLYGGTLLTGMVPELGSRVSWEGHLFGAIAGGVLAYASTKEHDSQPPGGTGRTTELFVW